MNVIVKKGQTGGMLVPLTCVAVALVLALGALMISGCGTVEGAGKDVQAVGRATSDAARGAGEAISGQR